MSARLLLSAAVQLLLHRHPSRATDKCSLTQSSLRTQTQQIRPLLQWESERGKQGDGMQRDNRACMRRFFSRLNKFTIDGAIDVLKGA